MQLVVRPYRLPLRDPWTTATTHAKHREGLLVWLVDGEHWGVGDASPLPGLEGKTMAALRAGANQLAATVAMDGELAEVAASVGPPAAHALRHGFVQARLDMLARRSRMPLWQRLRQFDPDGPAPPTSVLVNATLGLLDQDATEAAAKAAHSRGYRAFKMKVGPSPGDIRRVEAVRRIIGSEGLLRLDANGSWTPEIARAMLRELEPVDIDYIEQPLPPNRPKELAALARESRIPLAFDESAHHLPDALNLIEHGIATVIIVKPQALGGLDRAATLIAAARRLKAKAVVTDSVDSAVGRAGALHLAALLGEGAPPAGLASGESFGRDVVPNPILPVDGRLMVPTTHGSGVTLAPPEHP